MVRQIHLTTLRECPDKEWLGRFSTHDDYDEVITEDVDVFLPDGTLVLVFRKKALKTLVDITPERYDYWKWVSLDSGSVNRGDAAGSEIIHDTEKRLTKSQDFFLLRASKGEFDKSTPEEVESFLNENTKWALWHYQPKWVKEDGLVEVELVEDLEKRFKDKTLTESERKKVSQELTVERGKWFNNWVETKFLPSENRTEEAKRARKRYLGSQSWNTCASNVVGALDRQAIIPWARLTATTQKKWESFEAEAPFFREADRLFKKLMPANHKFLYDRFKEVKDPRFNLFDTAFTTVTVNYNFRVAYHRDKFNCKGGTAILSCISKGEYNGFGLIFPQMRLVFDIRHGDFLCGDNQGYIHGQMPLEKVTPDAESIWFVFYSKERLRFVDDLDCELCRRDFRSFASKNLTHKGNGKPSWGGIWPEMWISPEWDDYKSKNCPEASNTNWTMT